MKYIVISCLAFCLSLAVASCVTMKETSVTAPSSTNLVILKAEYGYDSEQLDVTEEVRSLIKYGALSVCASNGIAGDPQEGVEKELRIEYVLNGQRQVEVVPEGTMVRIGTHETPAEYRHIKGLRIIDAKYGSFEEWFDVRQELNNMVTDGKLYVVADNYIAGDPLPGASKELRVEYVLDSKVYFNTVLEDEYLSIP